MPFTHLQARDAFLCFAFDTSVGCIGLEDAMWHSSLSSDSFTVTASANQLLGKVLFYSDLLNVILVSLHALTFRQLMAKKNTCEQNNDDELIFKVNMALQVNMATIKKQLDCKYYTHSRAYHSILWHNILRWKSEPSEDQTSELMICIVKRNGRKQMVWLGTNRCCK